MKTKNSNYKVIITQKIPEPAVRLLKAENFSVRVLAPGVSQDHAAFLKAIKDADGLICLLSDRISEEVMAAMPRCKVIANYAVGFNNVSVAYASEQAIVVTNTPDVLTDATAEIAFALILAASRNIIQGEKLVRSGGFTGWQPELLRGPQLSGKTIGIIGAGRIGKAVAVRAFAFVMKVLYYSRSRKELLEAATGAKKVLLQRLMEQSDVISLHVPLNMSTNRLLNKEMLDLMKPNAVLVNTARGEVLDESYLAILLKKKKIFAAGFDVYTNEPRINPALLALDNVVLLPHLGSATFEARAQMSEIAAQNVIAVLHGKQAITPVN
jgi:glyoxylate reductase